MINLIWKSAIGAAVAYMTVLILGMADVIPYPVVRIALFSLVVLLCVLMLAELGCSVGSRDE